MGYKRHPSEGFYVVEPCPVGRTNCKICTPPWDYVDDSIPPFTIGEKIGAAALMLFVLFCIAGAGFGIFLLAGSIACMLGLTP